MSTKYLTLKEILRLHFQLIEDFGGSHGVRNEGRLKSVVDAPKQSVFGEEQHLTIFDKVAVYLRSIVGDHSFSDGNKRTTITVCGIFLLRNGYELKVMPKMLEDFMVKVATDHLNIEEIVIWLKTQTTLR